MPDKTTGWRKKIHARPKELKLAEDESAPVEDSGDRRRRHSDKSGWRLGSRPATPTIVTTPTFLQNDTEDARSEANSEATTPRRVTKPKLARYLSGYRSLKDASKEVEFGEPWGDVAPPLVPLVDPLVALQSVYTHMNTLPSRPIPVDHYSGLFRIFEDYRKVREEKERLDALQQETMEGFRQAEDSWADAEGRFQAEIRRLELLIANSASGMAGLMNARQGSVVDRRRTVRKTVTSDRPGTIPRYMSPEQLDEQIRLRSQKVLLHRPSSPSGKMAALSRQLSSTGSEDLPVGTPPNEDHNMTLTRKVKSELDLAKLGEPAVSNSHSLESEFSLKGDSLPDEMAPLPASLDPAIDCEALVALQELGILVARKKGINTDNFLNGLMQLFTTQTNQNGGIDEERVQKGEDTASLEQSSDEYEAESLVLTPNRRLRQIRSQPLLGSEQRRRRHFSFEPGDDQLATLEEGLKSYELGEDTGTDSQTVQSVAARALALDLESDDSRTPPQSLHVDLQKPSKIPSPVSRPGYGSVRRGDSTSSLQTVYARQYPEERRNSRSSVITAYRENSTGTLRPVPNSRSSSVGNLRHEESQQADQSGSPPVRSDVAAVAASLIRPEKGTKDNPSAGSSIHTIRTGKVKPENESPQ